MERNSVLSDAHAASQTEAHTTPGKTPPQPSVSTMVAAGAAALQRMLGAAGAAQARAQHALEKIPVTRDLLEFMGVWPGHSPNPETLADQSYGIVHGDVARKEAGDASAFSPDDINQGQLGDCYFLSAMAAVARTNPAALRRLIKDNGDGTYDVTLYVAGSHGWSNKTPQTVRITSEFPMQKGAIADAHSGSDRGGTGKTDDAELWPMLLEKALATIRGSYHAIEGGFGVDGFNVLLPTASAKYTISPNAPDQAFSRIAAALHAGRALTAGSVHSLTPALQKRADERTLVLGHEYSVQSVDVGKRKVQLQNPWGFFDLNLPIHEFVLFFNEYCVGAP